MEPRFSVIIPSFNRAATLGKAIESVIHQTSPAFEIIVVDDGSTDQTQQVVEAFPQVSYYYQENQGVSLSRNQGAEMANGDWLIFLDSDDELLPSALVDFSKAIREKPSASILLGGYYLIKNGLESVFIPEQGKYIGHLAGSFAVKREIFNRVGGYDCKLKYGENTELFFRLAYIDLEQAEVPFPIFKYNQDSSGGNRNLILMSESFLYILEKHPDLESRIKRLYHQVLGVNYIRFRRFTEARSHLWKAFLFQPLKLDTLARLGIAMIPSLAKRLYFPVPPYK